MTRYLLIWAIGTLMAISAFGQQDAPSVCPAISLSGPAGIFDIDKEFSYTLTLDSRADSYPLKFEWQISKGTIVSGQGTRKLTVKVGAEVVGGAVTATVRIAGLPYDCASEVSETVIHCPGPSIVLLDEFETPPESIADDRYITVSESMKNNPTAQMFVVIAASVRDKPAAIESRRQAFAERISSLTRIDVDRISFLNSDADVDLIKIYLVPPGASPPKP